jgi:hypothetical protein
MNPLLKTGVAWIEDAYRLLGHTLGVRFLTGPRATLAVDVNMGEKACRDMPWEQYANGWNF